jgi:hypothetical protein
VRRRARLDRLDRGAARRRARAHAVRLGRDLAELRQAEAAGDGDLAIRLRHRVRVTARNLGAALSRGLDADYGPDTDLGLLRGHARNLELVIRHCVDAALRPGAEPTLRSGWLEPAVRLADELAGAEWAGYVAGLLVRMPSIAAAALAAGAAQRGGLP